MEQIFFLALYLLLLIAKLCPKKFFDPTINNENILRNSTFRSRGGPVIVEQNNLNYTLSELYSIILITEF